MGDAALALSAEHVASAPAMIMPDPNSDLNTITVGLFAALNRLGMDPYKPRWPKLDDTDYQTNRRDLPALWGPRRASKTQVGDVTTRRRLAARLLHPDKLVAMDGEPIRQWANESVTT